MDFKRVSNLTFQEPDNKTFKGIALNFYAGREGGTMPAVFNAANEVAVELFLKGEIKFLEIYEIIEKSMLSHKVLKANSVKVIKKADQDTRKFVYEKFGK